MQALNGLVLGVYFTFRMKNCSFTVLELVILRRERADRQADLVEIKAVQWYSFCVFFFLRNACHSLSITS